jgi:putative chitinase
MSLIILAADLKKFAPRANPEYVAALLGGMETLRSAGILDTELRLCHFMGQVGAETGGFSVVRESLNYMTAKRVREVWPARFRHKSDIELAPLVRNPIRLGDEVYLGRMGNAHPGDGYTYRGGGFLQTTGRAAVMRYCKACEVPFRPDALDDISLTLRFACHEWGEAKCNDYADENDLTKVSKAINTGSAFSNSKPVGMTAREDWFAKAWAIWGSKGKADQPPKEPLSVKKVVATAGAAAVVAQPVVELVKPSAAVTKPALETATAALKQAQETQALVTQAKGVWAFVLADPIWIAAAAAVFAAIALLPKLLHRG